MAMGWELYARNRDEWRSWLSANHAAEKEVWLVFFKKKTGKPGVSYDDAVEEALCFGWIDSIVKKVNDEKYMQKFTPRTARASWSASNRERAERMILEGKMTPAGLNKVLEAKQSGRWEASATPRSAWAMPEELQAALVASPTARDNFEKLAPSYRRQFAGWIGSGKQRVTRLKRVKEAIELLERDQKLGLGDGSSVKTSPAVQIRFREKEIFSGPHSG
jgi:uncharacterized protein YdeI (YjbR/CyaY-like superfamily)